MQIAAPSIQRSTKDLIRSALLVTVMAGLTAVGAKMTVELPFSPVPITLQSFFVILSGALLGSKRGAASQVLLIGMGLAGLPVFSKPLPGLVMLLGPTGGYIIGFVLAAYVAGLLFERLSLKNIFASFAACFFASLFIFLPGVLWLSVYTGKDLITALTIGVVPFFVGDVIKCAMTALSARLLRPENH